MAGGQHSFLNKSRGKYTLHKGTCITAPSMLVAHMFFLASLSAFTCHIKAMTAAVVSEKVKEVLAAYQRNKLKQLLTAAQTN